MTAGRADWFKVLSVVRQIRQLFLKFSVHVALLLKKNQHISQIKKYRFSIKTRKQTDGRGG